MLTVNIEDGRTFVRFIMRTITESVLVSNYFVI